MNEELVKDKLETYERRLNNHGERIDKLEQRGARVDEKIDSLCTQLSNLTSTLKWFMGLIVGSFVAFFFYAVQHNIFK